MLMNKRSQNQVSFCEIVLLPSFIPLIKGIHSALLHGVALLCKAISHDLADIMNHAV